MLLCKIFFQTKSLFADFLGGVLAHIAVMPGLIVGAGDVRFAVGIAEDEAVFPCVLFEPGVYFFAGGVHAVGVDVHGKARLMLAVAHGD